MYSNINQYKIYNITNKMSWIDKLAAKHINTYLNNIIIKHKLSYGCKIVDDNACYMYTLMLFHNKRCILPKRIYTSLSSNNNPILLNNYHRKLVYNDFDYLCILHMDKKMIGVYPVILMADIENFTYDKHTGILHNDRMKQPLCDSFDYKNYTDENIQELFLRELFDLE